MKRRKKNEEVWDLEERVNIGEVNRERKRSLKTKGIGKEG
jgi:hypothetical protein